MLSLLLVAAMQLSRADKPIEVCCDELQINHVFDPLYRYKLDQLLVMNYSKEYGRVLVDNWIKLEGCRDMSNDAHKAAWEANEEKLLAQIRNDMFRTKWREGREYPGKFVYERINIDKVGEYWTVRMAVREQQYCFRSKKLTIRTTAFDREWEERDVRGAHDRPDLPKAVNEQAPDDFAKRIPDVFQLDFTVTLRLEDDS